MEPRDSELDQRLRAASKPPPEAVERVIGQTMATSERKARLPRRLVAAAATAAILAAVLGVRYWPRPSAERGSPTHPVVGIVLIRAPDGSSAIYTTEPDSDPLPPGSGFVISEGDQR